MSGATQTGRPRDPRLDFFRGIAMAIILIAHIPTNPWILWIPARFGFSDATETFVFCSGFASALAFGATFAERGWAMGTARIAHRVWQVYWAHLGVFFVTVALLRSIDAQGWGARAHPYVEEPYVAPFFERAGEALPALMTLRYVPGLFDILPMYLVILAMIPAVMALHRVGGTAAAAAASLGLWLAAQLAGFHAMAARWPETGPAAAALAEAGARAAALNLPAAPWDPVQTWFFNPFGWQIVFFAGFALGMGWLRPPPVTRGLFAAALAVVALSLPLAWHRLHDGLYLPDGSPLAAAFFEARMALEPFWWKSWQGALRLIHFLATAYLAWVLVGPGRARLLAPLPVAGRSPRRGLWLRGGLAALALTAPWAWSGAPGGWTAALPFMDRVGIGWLSLLHVAAAVVTLRHGLPDSALRRLAGPVWGGFVAAAQRVGSQSLAVFMTSIPLSQLLGLILDHIGRGMAQIALINAGGVAVLIGVAYIAAWFKAQPWRGVKARRNQNAAGRATAPAPAE